MSCSLGHAAGWRWVTIMGTWRFHGSPCSVMLVSWMAEWQGVEEQCQSCYHRVGRRAYIWVSGHRGPWWEALPPTGHCCHPEWARHGSAMCGPAWSRCCWWRSRSWGGRGSFSTTWLLEDTFLFLLCIHIIETKICLRPIWRFKIISALQQSHNIHASITSKNLWGLKALSFKAIYVAYTGQLLTSDR